VQTDLLRVANLLWLNDAVTAAEKLTKDYAQRRIGQPIGGPDVFRPWLIGRAGAAAEGTVAAACTPEGIVIRSGAGEDVSLTHAASLADYGTRVLLRALAADIAVHGQPARRGVADALGTQEIRLGLAWYQVEGGRWRGMGR
jgi:hypothetical protein